MKNVVLGKKTALDRGTGFLLPSAIFLLLALIMAVSLGGVVGTSDASISAFIVGALLFILVLALRQYELAAMVIVAIHIYIDWYLGRELVAISIAVGLLFFLFIIRSPQRPWKAPRVLWLWCLFLVLAISPVIQGAQGRYELAYYYPNIIFGALVMFWLGMLVARNSMHLRTLFQVLAVLGTLLAIHTVIQAR